MKFEDAKKILLQDPEVKREYDNLAWMLNAENIPLKKEYKINASVAPYNDIKIDSSPSRMFSCLK